MGSVHFKRFEQRDTPHPLGRHVQHDSRSRSFAFPVPAVPVKHVSVQWPHSTPVLNQGQKSSCTGNAMAQLLNCDMFAPVRAKVKALPEVAGSAPGDNWLTEGDALQFYSLATHNDGSGPSQFYPPNDDGSSGLGVVKGAQSLGFVDRYTHCFSFAQFQAAIQTQPVLLGTSWTDSMFSPNASGRISVGPLNDQSVVGGHEWLGIGIDYQHLEVLGLNSWGPGWGQHGIFRISFADFQALLADDGDVVVPHGVSLPG